jgi:hypothetical protein
MIASLRPSVVAVSVALAGHVGQSARICRLDVHFPDIGKQTLSRIGFLRYRGEASFVAPEATEQELELQPGLTTYL